MATEIKLRLKYRSASKAPKHASKTSNSGVHKRTKLTAQQKAAAGHKVVAQRPWVLRDGKLRRQHVVR